MPTPPLPPLRQPPPKRGNISGSLGQRPASSISHVHDETVRSNDATRPTNPLLDPKNDPLSKNKGLPGRHEYVSITENVKKRHEERQALKKAKEPEENPLLKATERIKLKTGTTGMSHHTNYLIKKKLTRFAHESGDMSDWQARQSIKEIKEFLESKKSNEHITATDRLKLKMKIKRKNKFLGGHFDDFFKKY